MTLMKGPSGSILLFVLGAIASSNMKFRDGNLKTISKAVSIQVAPAGTKVNKSHAIADQLKYVLIFAAHLGINRMYLLNYRRLFRWSFVVYSLCINVTTIYFLCTTKVNTASYRVIRITGLVEYVMLMAIAILSRKATLRSLFDDLATFDNHLNIERDLDLTLPVSRELYWIAGSMTYSLGEFILIILYVFEGHQAPEIWGMAVSYVTLMTHDVEQLLFCSLLRTIFLRVRILKAHIEKVLLMKKESRKKLDDVEVLSNKAQLDVSSLHRNYELLHKCAEQLNWIMSLPMMIMMLCSGVSSIMLLKTLFKALQTETDPLILRTVTVYTVTRCLKYTLLVVISCYYSSVTTSQVAHIRTMLHDAMNSDKMDKLERRRIKAFFQLTRESEFAYALWGVIRLNMSLPLSYLSLCTTYLVIIIQFSKFID